MERRPITLEMLDWFGGLDTLPWSLDNINLWVVDGEATIEAVTDAELLGGLMHYCDAEMSAETDESMISGMMKYGGSSVMEAESAEVFEGAVNRGDDGWVETDTLIRTGTWS